MVVLLKEVPGVAEPPFSYYSKGSKRVRNRYLRTAVGISPNNSTWLETWVCDEILELTWTEIVVLALPSLICIVCCVLTASALRGQGAAPGVHRYWSRGRQVLSATPAAVWDLPRVQGAAGETCRPPRRRLQGRLARQGEHGKNNQSRYGIDNNIIYLHIHRE